MAALAPTTKSSAGNRTTLIEGCLLVGIAAMLLRKAWDGQLPLYIHPRYTALIVVTACVLFVIGEVRLWQTSRSTENAKSKLGAYGLLLTPFVLGIVIPAQPAGSALVDPQQFTTAGQGYQTQQVDAASDSTQWSVIDWNFARITLSAAEAQGKPVDVIGFVYRDATLPADQFYVVRYSLACCVADRNPAALPIIWAGADTLTNDTWVHVTGKIAAQDGIDSSPPTFTVVDAQVEQVEQPNDPYLYQ